MAEGINSATGSKICFSALHHVNALTRIGIEWWDMRCKGEAQESHN
jgi:hypothetical protein